MTDINKIFLGSQEGKAIDKTKLKAGIQIDKFSEDSKKLAQALNTTKNAQGEFDNVLNQEEIMKFWDKLSQSAKDNTLNKRGGDINRFLESLGFKKGDFSKDQVMKFLQEVVELNDEIDSVKNVVTEDENGEKVLSGIKVAYKSGGGQLNADSTLVEAGTYTDGSNSKTIKDSNGHTTFTAKDADGKTTLVYYDRNTNTNEGVKRFIDGSIINHQEDIYLNDEDNSTSDTLVRRITVTEDGLTVIQKYDDKGKETARKVSYFDQKEKMSIETESKVITTADGKTVPILESETYNKGLPNEYTIFYQDHDAEGNPTESITSKINPETGEMQNITTTYKDGKKATETIEEGKDLTKIIYGEDGKPEIKHELKDYQTTYDEEGNPKYNSKTMISTTYDKDGKPVEQRIISPEGEKVVNLNGKPDTVAKPAKKQYKRTNLSAIRAQEECAEREKTTLKNHKIDPKMGARNQVAHDLVEYYKAQGLSDEQAQAKVFTKTTLNGKDFYTNKALETPEGIAMYLFTQEGNKSVSKSSFEARVQQIKDNNPEVFDPATGMIKDGKQLHETALNLPVDAKLYEKLGGEVVRQNNMNIQADEGFARRDGADLARQARSAMKGAGTRVEKLDNVVEALNKDNITGFLQGYRQQNGESFIAAVRDENALMGDAVIGQEGREAQYISQVKSALAQRSKELGLNNDELLNSIKTNTPTKDIDAILSKITAEIDSLEALAPSERQDAVARMNGDLKTDDLKDITNIGKAQRQAADKSLEEFLKTDGFFGDLYDGLKTIGGSNSTDQAVRKDIQAFQNKLDTAVKVWNETKDVNKFKEAFEAQFGAGSNPGLIKQYQNLSQKIEVSANLDTVSNYFKNHENKSEAELRELFTVIQAAQPELFKDVSVENLSKQDMNNIINNIVNTLREQKGTSSSTEELMQARQGVLKGMFGEQNDVAARVQEYADDQRKGAGYAKMAAKVGAAVAATIATLPAGGTGGIGVLATIETAAAVGTATFAVDVGDYLWREKVNGGEPVTREELQQSAKEALLASGLTATGLTYSKYIMKIEAMSNAAKAGVLAPLDITAGAAGEVVMTGDITIEGTLYNAFFAATGHLIGLRKASASEKPTGTQPEPNILEVATGDNTHGVGGKLGTKRNPKTGESKYEAAKRQTRDIAKNGTPEEVVKVHDEAGKLRKVSGDQGRPLEQIILDENNIVKIGKERIDLATADAATLAKAKKAIENYSGRGIDKIKDAIEARETELANGTVRTEPARSTQVNDGINTRVKRDAVEILADKGKPIGPTDAATLTDHVANNLNDIDALNKFIREVKESVGTYPDGRMYKMEVQGVDHAQRVVDVATKKLNRLEAQKANFDNVISKIDDAITNKQPEGETPKGSRGLNGTEQQTIKDFANRSNSIEDLQALVTKLKSNKSVRKSANGIIGFIENKLTVLRSKAVSTQTGGGRLMP